MPADKRPPAPTTVAELVEQLDRANGERLFTTVLNQVLAARTTWTYATEAAPPVSVNISVAALRRQLPGVVAAALERSGTHPSELRIEVTETGFADPVAVDTLKELHQMGVSLALDDFGSGWSSMARLAELPWSALKIDRTFIAGLGTSRAHDTVIHAAIDLAHSLGIQAIAEGVETPQQRTRLEQLGCDAAQGFLLGRPGTALPTPDDPRVEPNPTH